MPQHGGLSVVFLGCAGLAAIWLAFAATMRYEKQPCLLGCHYEYINRFCCLVNHWAQKTPSREGQGIALL